MTPAILCHGGSGEIPAERHARLREGVGSAARAGHAILAGGGSSLDAVVTAVRILEDDPEFNAGIGSALARDGTVETDASVMDGATQRAGAVAAVPNLGNPIVVARHLLDAGEHVILGGPAALRFAAEHGISPAAPDALITERARTQLAARIARSGGTVGAVARDHLGNYAAATSTGGISGKRPGRIGDSPIPGAGTWADTRCAISATGDGEAILRVALARSIALRLDAGPARATRESLAELARITGGRAGVIVLADAGWVALRLSSAMSVAWITADGAGDSMSDLA